MAPEHPRIVRSLAGHDKGGLFCVLDEDGPYLLLCDGRRRKAESPKRKKAVHTAAAGDFHTPFWRSSGRVNPLPTERCGGRWPLSELKS